MKKAKRERPKTCDVAARLKDHPMNTPSDLAYLRGKGYSDEEVLAFWDRDQAQGKAPVHHREALDLLTEGLKANLTPPAVAALANAIEDYVAQREDPKAALYQTMDDTVVRQLKWMAEQMIDVLGGKEAYHDALGDAAV